jgi:hypothetical protein
MMVIGAETFTLQSRKAHPAIWVTKPSRGPRPQDFFGVGRLPRAILSAQPQRARSRDQSVTGRKTIRPASSDMTLSSCGGSCGPRCRQRSGRRDRSCSGGGAIAHLAQPPRQERRLGGRRSAVRNLYEPRSQNTESRGRLAVRLAAEQPANRATGCPCDCVGSTSGVPL